MKWPFTKSDNTKKIIKNSDSLKWSNIGSSPLEWSDMGSLNQNKQDDTEKNPETNIKPTEQFDMRKLILEIEKNRPTATPNNVKQQLKGVGKLRPNVDSENMKKVLTGVEELPREEEIESEEDDDSYQEENDKDQQITFRNIKTKKPMGHSSPSFCPEDTLYLEHIIGMRPIKYKFVESGTVGNENQNQHGERSRQQSPLSRIKSSGTRNVRFRNEIRPTRRSLIQKLRTLSIFRN
ncbi:uncharacterized protein LOC129964103 [Argiope bruennichi]|uniref:uncharacterized protein LOC129964103 n=1 Tax=Argiope bruennichi TaxID=94029 RepID=UPI0024957305|nr:uncharacterized protein LOC129964103 [Argiope bruennichi]XP_055934772.1 uncharacterized protein LOC129964103 [Argiope bruennichi]